MSANCNWPDSGRRVATTLLYSTPYHSGVDLNENAMIEALMKSCVRYRKSVESFLGVSKRPLHQLGWIPSCSKHATLGAPPPTLFFTKLQLQPQRVRAEEAVGLRNGGARRNSRREKSSNVRNSSRGAGAPVRPMVASSGKRQQSECSRRGDRRAQASRSVLHAATQVNPSASPRTR